MLNILVDTREKKPWQFNGDVSVTSKKLKTGDYTLEGLENIFVIERKSSLAEFAANIVTDRFKKELERLVHFKYKFLLLEFSFQDILKYPVGSIPRKLWKRIRTTGAFIISCMAQIHTKYDVHVILCDNTANAIYIATSLMKRVIALEKPVY